MPRALSHFKKPDASELFTGRSAELKLLRRAVAPVPTGQLGCRNSITVFYGVGGVGKSSLCNLGMELGRATEWAGSVTCVCVDFDDQRWTPSSGISLVAAEFCRALMAAGVPLSYTAALLAIQQAAPQGGVDQRWEIVRQYAISGIEGLGVPGLGMLVRATKALLDSRSRTILRERMESMGLWPAETSSGQVKVMDLEEKLSAALCHDILAYLEANPGRHLRLFIDGFERLQGRTLDRGVAQWHIKDLLGYLVSSESAAAARFRALAFGREPLVWDKLYQDPTWPDYWSQHCLGGLTEGDAVEFLGRSESWHREHCQEAFADMIAAHRESILHSAEEHVDGGRSFHAYALNLALDILERATTEGRTPDFGRTPLELQDRFLRYLDEHERRALQVLALAAVFNEQLFDWLCQRRLIRFEVGTFHSALRQDRSYFLQVEGRPGCWKLHRKMAAALLAGWGVTDASHAEGRDAVIRILGHYAESIRAKTLRDWDDGDVESWQRGVELILAQGPEAGAGALLSTEEWESLIGQEPWSAQHHRCIALRLGITRRLLRHSERLHGSEDPRTLVQASDLGGLLVDLGNYAEAEECLRKLCGARERLHGPVHETTARSWAKLAILLHLKGDIEEAEVFHRRALAGAECTLGAEHPVTAKILDRLAVLLHERGDLVAAEPMHRRALVQCEASLGREDPETLSIVTNLAYLLFEKGELEEAEKLCRRAHAGWESAYGPEHPSTLVAMGNIAEVLACQAKYQEAEASVRQAIASLRKILGNEHLETLNSMDTLAGILEKAGRIGESEEIFRQVVEGQTKGLGGRHPHTLRSMRKLAGILEVQDKLAEAGMLFQQCVDGCLRARGAEHPETILCREGLARVQSKQH